MGTESVNASLNLISIVPDLKEDEEYIEADAVNVMIERGLRASLIGFEGGLRASLIGSEENSSSPSYGTFHSDSQDLHAKVRTTHVE